MRMTIATKKVGSGWEGALVVEGKFLRAFASNSLSDLVNRGIVALSEHTLPDGTDVVFDVICETPEEAEKLRAAREANEAIARGPK
jgi:hypothetical protein